MTSYEAVKFKSFEILSYLVAAAAEGKRKVGGQVKNPNRLTHLRFSYN